MLQDTISNPLFTIGHSTLEFDAFVALLKENDITAVADVRSSPYSRFSPQYNMPELRRALLASRIQYVFLGEELGARRSEAECYVDDVAKYDLIASTELFAKGIQRLRAGLTSHRIALLCAEKDPITCHRMILICRQLREGVAISHIVGPGECETQEAAEMRLLKLVGISDRDLFRSRAESLDDAYAKQGEEIAYRRQSLAGANAAEGD